MKVLLTEKRELFLWELLITLLLINYQVVVILANDCLVLKFLRDIVLLVLIVYLVFRKERVFQITPLKVAVVCFAFFLFVAALKTNDLGVSLIFVRRYLFPVGVLFVIGSSFQITMEGYYKVLRFLLNIMFVLAVWGIVQALLLGDQFLLNLGYLQDYSEDYQRVALANAYYIGTLEIQRVVSTLNSPNIYAVILGTSILTYLMLGKEILKSKFDIVKLVCMIVAYILTYSRANFLAMLIVVILFAWMYIPYKKWILVALGCCVVAFFLVYLIQDDGGITHQVAGWIVASLTFEEASAGWRAYVWADAFNGVKAHPWGWGFGKVGGYAYYTGAAELHHSENSYLAMALDLGLLGLLSFVAIIGCIVKKFMKYRSPETKKDIRIGISVLVYFLIAIQFSNHIHDMEVVSFAMFMLGLQMMKVRIMRKQDV